MHVSRRDGQGQVKDRRLKLRLHKETGRKTNIQLERNLHNTRHHRNVVQREKASSCSHCSAFL